MAGAHPGAQHGHGPWAWAAGRGKQGLHVGSIGCSVWELMGPKLEGKVSTRLHEPSWVSRWIPGSLNHKATQSLSTGPCVRVRCESVNEAMLDPEETSRACLRKHLHCTLLRTLPSIWLSKASPDGLLPAGLLASNLTCSITTAVKLSGFK